MGPLYILLLNVCISGLKPDPANWLSQHPGWTGVNPILYFTFDDESELGLHNAYFYKFSCANSPMVHQYLLSYHVMYDYRNFGVIYYSNSKNLSVIMCYPAGIFDSGSVHPNGNLNGWVHMDMNGW